MKPDTSVSGDTFVSPTEDKCFYRQADVYYSPLKTK